MCGKSDTGIRTCTGNRLIQKRPGKGFPVFSVWFGASLFFFRKRNGKDLFQRGGVAEIRDGFIFCPDIPIFQKFKIMFSG